MSPSQNQTTARLSAGSFARLSRFITAELGIKMPDLKLPMVQSRLLRRVRELGFESIEEYTQYFFHSPNAAEEREHFINAITTNKTDFFREPRHFDFLTERALPAMGFGGGGPKRRTASVWSAGCSTGEEPYTLAMVLGEYAERHPGFDFTILGTDVSTRVLDHARMGIYAETQIAPVAAALRSKYLMRSRRPGEKLVRVVPELRQKVSFQRLNFMDADYAIDGDFDIVFFRNVMIYFERSTQEIVLNRICRHLVAGGHLFAGHSESLAGLHVPVTPVHTAIYRRS